MKWFKCSKCHQEKDETCFYNDKSKKTGKKPQCKPCEKLSLNKEARRVYEAKYRKENPEKRSAIVRKSMANNIEHHKTVRRLHLATDHGRAVHRRQTQKRYALKKSAFVESVCPQALYEKQNGTCYLCSEKFEFHEMECDHVIPLSRGGLHQVSNCKMACIFCNRSKGAKLLEELSYQMV